MFIISHKSIYILHKKSDLIWILIFVAVHIEDRTKNKFCIKSLVCACWCVISLLVGMLMCQFPSGWPSTSTNHVASISLWLSKYVHFWVQQRFHISSSLIYHSGDLSLWLTFGTKFNGINLEIILFLQKEYM